MRALIMAGGIGRRLNLGEKPLVSVCGRPMLSYVIDAFRSAGCEAVVATTMQTPVTRNWCRTHGIRVYRSSGNGYIEDMIEIVNLLEEKNPLFVSVSDLPCLNVRTVIAIKNAYFNSGRDACSTWIPVKRWKSRRENIPYREWIDGIEAFPAGINILRGDRIADPQDEYKILSDDPCLALNVNTRADLSEAELFMKCQDS